jgi:hypothetical protein
VTSSGLENQPAGTRPASQSATFSLNGLGTIRLQYYESRANQKLGRGEPMAERFSLAA